MIDNVLYSNRRKRLSKVAVFAVACCSIAACGLDDPYDRPGTWTAENLNDRNIALMVAHPRDLVYGASDPTSPGQISAAAVRRLLTDKVKTLPVTDVGTVVSGGGAAPAAAGGAGEGL